MDAPVVQAQAAVTPEQAAAVSASLGTVNTAAEGATLTLEQKIENATIQAGQIASIFSPVVGTAIGAGAAMEPVVSAFIQLIAALFKHHTA